MMMESHDHELLLFQPSQSAAAENDFSARENREYDETIVYQNLVYHW